MATVLTRWSGMLWIAMTLVACDEPPGARASKDLPLPERVGGRFVTDQLAMAGKDLFLWSDGGGCQLQESVKGRQQGDARWLKPTAPCYFIKSPGTERVQVYQHDKNTRVVAVVGTPVPDQKPGGRCGTDVQGLIFNAAGSVRLSENTRSGSAYCAEQGLDNLEYSLFMTQ